MIKYAFALLFLIRIEASGQGDSLRTNSIDTIPGAAVNEAAADKIPVYKLKPAVDIPLTLISGGWSMYAFSKIYSKDQSTEATILALRKEDINGFDRWAADIYSKKAAKTSDLFFYGAMPLPIILLADKHIRKDALKIGFLYLEAMSVTGLLYTGSTYLTDRYRPLAYNPEVSIGERRGGGAKNSFFAGHVALVATSTFFTAKVFSDYHPQSKIRWVFYSVAIIATSGTAYLRHRGGKHFPSDILLGTAVGTLSGLLVPHFHKNKSENSKLSIRPFTGKSHGLYLAYKI
ncbi:MAG: phosphatase PAP2 family protein, partial [Chitinophagaceae bacterium]